jgi:hypothetical protein
MELETKIVRTKGNDAEQTINASDFDPAIHTEVNPQAASAPVKAEVKTEKAPEKPASKPTPISAKGEVKKPQSGHRRSA